MAVVRTNDYEYIRFLLLQVFYFNPYGFLETFVGNFGCYVRFFSRLSWGNGILLTHSFHSFICMRCCKYVFVLIFNTGMSVYLDFICR